MRSFFSKNIFRLHIYKNNLIYKGMIVMISFPSQSQMGFSLLESMVAVLVISVGLLGVASMQMLAMKGSHHAFQQGRVSDLMKALLERMRSNATAVYNDDYTIVNSSSYKCSEALTKNCEDGSTVCDAKELAKSDLYHAICGYDSAHLGGIQGALADGAISISCLGGASTCAEGINFTMRWSERVLGQEAQGKAVLAREIRLDTVIAP
jgi:type IV pilus assembly protein PilV